MDIHEANRLGFTDIEYHTANGISNACGWSRIPSISTLQQMLYIDYNSAYRIRYLIELMSGRHNVDIYNIYGIEDIRNIARHFRKINSSCIKLTVDKLPASKISTIPKIAILCGIRDKRFAELNSKNPNNISEYYLVDKTEQERYILRTSKKIADHGEDEDKIVNILGRDTNSRIIVSAVTSHVRLCNRYIAVASTRQPQYHNGMYVLVNPNGDIVYVYSKTVAGYRNIGKNYSERVYKYGIIPNELDKVLKETAIMIGNNIGLVAVTRIEPTQEFRLLENNKHNECLV